VVLALLAQCVGDAAASVLNAQDEKGWAPKHSAASSSTLIRSSTSCLSEVRDQTDKCRRSLLVFTSREQTFDPRLKWALVPVFFAPETRETFSPGWSHQPGLKVSLVSGAKNTGTRVHFDQ